MLRLRFAVPFLGASILQGALLLVIAGLAPAQIVAPDIDATTPSGELLQQIGMAGDAAQKATLLASFLEKFPNDAAVPWVLLQQVDTLQGQGDHEGVLRAADALAARKVLTVRPWMAAVKSAEALQRPDAVLQWATMAHEACEKTLAAPTPDSYDEDAWKAEQEYARQVMPLAEYAFANLASQSQDGVAIAKYTDALQKRNSKSEYLQPMYTRQLQAARAANQKDAALQAAESLVALNGEDVDALLYLASHYLETKQKQEKIPEYTAAALASIEKQQRPEGVAEDDFAKRQNLSKGVAYWLQGVHAASGSRWADANRSLRSALPLIAGNAPMQAAAYFYLGLANFEIGKKSKDHKEVVDAVKFTEQCAAMNSPYKAQAQQNLKAMRAQFRF